MGREETGVKSVELGGGGWAKSNRSNGSERVGTHRDETDTDVVAVWNHLALFFSVKQIVVVLHAATAVSMDHSLKQRVPVVPNELVPAACLGNVLQGLELPGVHL